MVNRESEEGKNDTEEINEKVKINEEKDGGTFKAKLLHVFRNITVEPILLCFVFPQMITYLATQNLNLEKACRVNLNFTAEICDRIIENQDVDDLSEEIQQTQLAVSAMQLWKAPLQLVLPAIFIIFVGSWSDRSGRRKPFMIIPPIGEFISCMGLILCVVYFTEWPLEVAAFIEAIPSAICGGYAIMFMAVFSYLADITTPENRTFRLASAGIITAIGSPVGQAMSGFIIKYGGYYGVFSFIGALYFTAIVYTIVRIKDKHIKIRENKPCLLVDLFNPTYAIGTFKVLLKPRQNYNRFKLILLVFMCLLVTGPTYGEYGVVYLFVRYKFNFTEVDYSIFGAYSSVIQLSGTLFSITILIHRYKVNDYLLGIMAGCSKIASTFVLAFAPTVAWFYVGPFVDCLSGVGTTVVKSLASKLVEPDEVARIYSLLGVLDALAPTIYYPLYNFVYQNSINTFPGAFYFVSTMSVSVCVFCHIVMYLMEPKSPSRVDSKNKISD